MTVYVPNDVHTATDAEPWGDIKYLTRGHVSRTAVRENYERIREGLAESRPDDWLVVGSLSVLTALCAGEFAALHGKLNLLLWEHGRYLPRQVTSL